ncbi:hypothetical protein [Mycoplasma sp. CB776]
MNQIKQIKQLGKYSLIVDIISYVFIFVAIVLSYQINSIIGVSKPKSFEAEVANYKTRDLIVLFTFIIAGIIGFVAVIFKIMASALISNLNNTKLADAKLYYVLSIFFGIIFTFMGYKRLEAFKYEEPIEQEERLNIRNFSQKYDSNSAPYANSNPRYGIIRDQEEDVQEYEKNYQIQNLKKTSRLTLIFDIVNAVLIFIAIITIVISLITAASDVASGSYNYNPNYGRNDSDFVRHITKLAGVV